MWDWIAAFGWLVALIVGWACCLLFARLSWQRSQNGRHETWLVCAVLGLLWSGCFLPAIFHVAEWLIAHAWLLG